MHSYTDALLHTTCITYMHTCIHAYTQYIHASICREIIDSLHACRKSDTDLDIDRQT